MTLLLLLLLPEEPLSAPDPMPWDEAPGSSHSLVSSALQLPL